MDFVWMKHDGVVQPARVPVTAVPHWEGNGWEQTDPPPKPVRRAQPTAQQKVAETVTDVPVEKRATAKPDTKPKAAPAGHKED